MNKIIIGLIVISLVLISGCSSYESCFDDCAKVECGYSGIIRASLRNKLNTPCLNNNNKTIKEYCYEECKGV